MNANAFPVPLMIDNRADGSEKPFRLLDWFVFRWEGWPGVCEAQDLVVPAGFATDFASIPRPAQGFLNAVNDVAPAAVVHDFLYVAGVFESRAVADRVFLDALAANGVGWMRRRILWAAVRLGGRRGFVPNIDASTEALIEAAAAKDRWECSR